MKKIALAAMIFSAIGFAEDPAPAPVVNPDQPGALTPEAPGGGAGENRVEVLKKLAKKLINRKGEPITMVIFSPIDFTATQVGPTVSSTLHEAIMKYGNINVREEDYQIQNLTVSEFRRGMAEFHADVVVVTSLRNTNFDLYIYDRRNPYHIYAHSEPIPEVTQLQINEEVAQQYTRLVLRRALYRFINDQYFELPRDDMPPVLQSEIPKWITSPDSLARMNREITSPVYASVYSGGAFSVGPGVEASPSIKTWNQQLIGLQLGIRVFGRLFLEVGAHQSAYNAFFGSLRYVFANRNSPFQIGLGLGAGYITAMKVWSPDAYFGLGIQDIFVVPSVAIMFPIGDVYLKVETQAFVTPGFDKFMFTVMPGILLFF